MYSLSSNTSMLCVRMEKDRQLSYLWPCVWSAWFQVGSEWRDEVAVTLSPCTWCRTRLMMSKVNRFLSSLSLAVSGLCAPLFPNFYPSPCFPPIQLISHLFTPSNSPHYHHSYSLIRTEYLIRCHSSSL
jgi:hypothetical protein